MTDIAGWKITADNPKLVWDNKGLHGDFIIKAEIDTKSFDDEKMIVSGFATVEEVDKQGDLITLDAFRKAVGRLEADKETLSLNYGHTSAKIGTVTKMVFMEDSTPRKLWIEAQLKRNSKLAKQAWEDVKSQKLKAFSIGGMALVPGLRWCEASGKCMNKIDDIEWYEVSLVEEPANQKSLIMAIKGALPDFQRTMYSKEDGKLIKASCMSDYTNSDGTFQGGFDGCVSAMEDCKGLPTENAKKLCAYIGRQAGKIAGDIDVKALEAEMMKEEDNQRVKDLEDIVQGLVMVMRGQLLGKNYPNFDACVADNQDKEDPEGFCAYLGRGGKGETLTPMETLDKACSGKTRFPAFGRKTKKGETVETITKEDKPAPTPAPAPTPEPNKELEELRTKLSAMEAEAKLQRMEREKAEKALQEATKKAETPPAPAPAPTPTPTPAPQIQVEQPSSKGEHPGASPQSPGPEMTVMELAHKLNDEKKPLSWGM